MSLAQDRAVQIHQRQPGLFSIRVSAIQRGASTPTELRRASDESKPAWNDPQLNHPFGKLCEKSHKPGSQKGWRFYPVILVNAAYPTSIPVQMLPDQLRPLSTLCRISRI